MHGILGQNARSWFFEMNQVPDLCSCILTRPHLRHFHFRFLW